MGTDVGLGTKPNRQRPAYHQSKSRQHQAENQTHHNGLPHHLPRINTALGSQQMGYLYGITRGKGTQYPLE